MPREAHQARDIDNAQRQARAPTCCGRPVRRRRRTAPCPAGSRRIAGHCRASTGRDRERRQGRQQLGVADMAQEHVHQPDHDQHAASAAVSRRAPARDRARSAGSASCSGWVWKSGDLHSVDQGQRIAQAEDLEGHQDRAEAVGRDAGRPAVPRRRTSARRGRSSCARQDRGRRPEPRVAKAPASIRPRVKPPCRLAQTSIATSSNGSGARRSSTARIRPATHHSMKGKASANGRARKCERHHGEGRRGEQQRRQRPDVLQQQAQQHRRGDAESRRAQRHHAAPAAGVVGQRHQHLRQPIPWRSRAGR